jgi:hypothetical protein
MSSISFRSESLTSSEMNMIGGLLIEGRRNYPERNLAFFSDPARLLVRSFQAGVTSQSGLRDVLNDYLAQPDSLDQAIDRWNDEGGLLPCMAA